MYTKIINHCGCQFKWFTIKRAKLLLLPSINHPLFSFCLLFFFQKKCGWRGWIHYRAISKQARTFIVYIRNINDSLCVYIEVLAMYTMYCWMGNRNKNNWMTKKKEDNLFLFLSMLLLARLEKLNYRKWISTPNYIQNI